MAYTLGEAARVTGKSKPAISKAIKSGRLSASRADDGSYRIDPAELERVYPVTGSLNGQGRRDETQVDTSELTLWRTLAIEREATIRDLRARLELIRERSAADRGRAAAAFRAAARAAHRAAGKLCTKYRVSAGRAERVKWLNSFRVDSVNRTERVVGAGDPAPAVVPAVVPVKCCGSGRGGGWKNG